MKVILTHSEAGEIAALLRKLKGNKEAAGFAKYLIGRRRTQPNTQDYQEAAKWQQKDGEIEIDDDPTVSHGADNGAYVQAWIWIERDDMLTARRERKAKEKNAKSTEAG